MMMFIRPRFSLPRIAVFSLFCLLGVHSVNAQKKSSSSAPAPKPAPAAKPAAKPATNTAAKPNTSTTAHTTPNSTTARPGTTGSTTAHTTTAGGTANRGTTGATTARSGTTGNNGRTTTTANTGKTGTTASAKTGGTTTGAKPGGATAGGAKPGGATNTAAKPGTVTHPGGGKTVTTANGATKNYGANGHLNSVSTKSGHTANYDSHGRVTTIHTAHGAEISHGPHGERRVVGERVNARGEHYHVVNYGHGRGYVEHGYMRGGHPYYRRTYMYGGRRYAYAYRGYYWHGVAYYHWAPPYYYPAAYYGWAVTPWVAPVPYAWGWGAAPWYGFYGVYFAPAPVYPFAALWLADFVIAANLQASYEAAAAADPNAANLPDYAPFMINSGASLDGLAAFGGGMEFDPDAAAAAMPADVKQLVSDDIKAQIEEEKAAAAGPAGGDTANEQVPAALDPKHTVFLVSSTIDVPNGDDTCSLTAGDIVQRQENEAGDDKAVKVKVLSAKSQDCAMGSFPRVQVTDLQDMHNDFREKISSGMDTLAKGGNGLPKAPDATHKTNPDGQAQPDLNADDDLNAQQADADAAEKEVQAANQPDKP
jgi:hypothetical protein